MAPTIPRYDSPPPGDDAPLSARSIAEGIAPRVVGRRIYCFKRADSTNRVAKKLALRRVPDGTLVIADYQTAGRGRLDRRWLAPAGTSLLCSFVLYPALPLRAAGRVTMLAAIAVCRAIAETCPVEPGIKWPNDIYLNGQKVCGILSECEAAGDRIAYAVVGIGINVNFDPGMLPEISSIATSLRAACGRPVSRLPLLQRLITHLDGLYCRLRDDGFPELTDLWKRSSCIVGRPVVVSGAARALSGIARDFTADGHLLLEDAAGALHTIVCGDVSLGLLPP